MVGFSEWCRTIGVWVVRGRWHGGLACVWLLWVAGCGHSVSPAIECLEAVQTQTLLMSEVDQQFTGPEGCQFEMVFRNPAATSQELRVKAVGCSCFSVKHEGQKLKVGDVLTLADGQAVSLILESPRPTIPKTTDYNYVMESLVDDTSDPVKLECRGTVKTLADLSLNPSLLQTSFGREDAPQRIPFEIVRTARTAEAAQIVPTVTGWPTNATWGPLVSRGTPVEEQGLWTHCWTTVVEVRPPQGTHLTDQASTLMIRCPDIPPMPARMLVRLNYGLSAPALVHLSRVTVGIPASRRIQVRSRDQVPFRIIECQGGPAVLARVENPEAAATHWIDLIASPSEAGEWEQRVIVKTDHRDTPALEIQMKALVALSESGR